MAMVTSEIFEKHVEAYEKWYEDHTQVYESEILALKEQLGELPENIHGIEVGVGTGRFAAPLGIKEGVEPSEPMAAIAIKRGIEIMNAVGERLPYGDLQFDFVLFVTICHLSNVKESFKEAHRVLKRGGAILVGFLDKERSIAKAYKERGGRSKFYSNAQFYKAKHIEKILDSCGFKNVEFNQTLFGNLEEIQELQIPIPGYGQGSFVVAKALKK